jgi:hypothetical protein
MDGDIQEEESLSLNNKKASSPAAIPKKSINRNVPNLDKEKTISVKSVNKIKEKEKNPIIKGKKNQKKESSISLDESENDNENEIKVTTEVKISSQIQKKGTSKPPKKKSINTTKDIMNDPEKKNKMNEKKNGKKNEIDEEVMQCELSSESENENIKEVNSNSRPNKRKNNNNKNKRNNKMSSDDYDSGYFSSRKTSQKKKKINENKELKSRSTIKLSLRDNSMKSKASNFLGKKRKIDQKSEESDPIVKVKYPKAPSQMKAGKQKSKTPLKNNPKKNNKNNHNDLSMSKMDIDEQNGDKKYAIPELALLNQLITEYGFERVLDSFCKSTLNKKNKLDLCLQGLKNSCSNERLPFLLIKMLFSYFDDKYEVSYRKRSTSSIKKNNLKNISDNSNESQNNKNNSDYSLMDNCEDASPNEVKEEGAQDIKDKNKKSKCLDNNNNNNKGVKNKKGDEKKGEKKMMSIGSHYNKSEDGKVYKYQIVSLDGKGNALFKCYDDKCSGTGNYNIETKEFSITKDHSLTHAEHDYIINSEKDGDKVFKDLIDNDKSDAQVFKENGERIVKIY